MIYFVRSKAVKYLVNHRSEINHPVVNSWGLARSNALWRQFIFNHSCRGISIKQLNVINNYCCFGAETLNWTKSNDRRVFFGGERFLFVVAYIKGELFIKHL